MCFFDDIPLQKCFSFGPYAFNAANVADKEIVVRFHTGCNDLEHKIIIARDIITRDHLFLRHDRLNKLVRCFFYRDLSGTPGTTQPTLCSLYGDRPAPHIFV